MLRGFGGGFRAQGLGFRFSILGLREPLPKAQTLNPFQNKPSHFPLPRRARGYHGSLTRQQAVAARGFDNPEGFLGGVPSGSFFIYTHAISSRVSFKVIISSRLYYKPKGDFNIRLLMLLVWLEWLAAMAVGSSFRGLGEFGQLWDVKVCCNYVV